MEDGKQFIIEAAGNSEQNVYIDSAELNGSALDRNWISYGEITQGGKLSLKMSAEPNTERGTGKEAAPFSLSKPLE
jgi:putative alpha-1,2-mannosidase